MKFRYGTIPYHYRLVQKIWHKIDMTQLAIRLAGQFSKKIHPYHKQPTNDKGARRHDTIALPSPLATLSQGSATTTQSTRATKSERANHRRRVRPTNQPNEHQPKPADLAPDKGGIPVRQ
uniref:Uncharacterized protein n=1 Tax=Malus domestica TaxID=3750 RepID=E4Z8M9_MALDO|nr:Conserved hypothetical protein [Malus domestica]